MKARRFPLVDELGGMDSAVEIIKKRQWVRDVNRLWTPGDGVEKYHDD